MVCLIWTRFHAAAEFRELYEGVERSSTGEVAVSHGHSLYYEVSLLLCGAVRDFKILLLMWSCCCDVPEPLDFWMRYRGEHVQQIYIAVWNAIGNWVLFPLDPWESTRPCSSLSAWWTWSWMLFKACVRSAKWYQFQGPCSSPTSHIGTPLLGDWVCRCFFDPSYWKIVLFDQRGCGKSKPTGSLAGNTTQVIVYSTILC